MVFKASAFLMLLLLVGFACQEPAIVAEARPVAFLAQERYSKIFSTLGVVCKCCDGAAIAGGEHHCTTSWHGTCSDIRCLPWKFRS